MTIHEMYGQTETGLLVNSMPPIPVRPGSMGKPIPGYDVAILDDEGRELPPGEEGHIALRIQPEAPAVIFRGYWDDPELTEQTFSRDWYLTGDRASRDEDGYFWFAGRSDDMITSAAYRISPFEVESALQEHPAVAESAVVGSPDPIRGQIVKAFVVLAPDYTPSDGLAEEIQAFVRANTAPYKYPRRIEFVSDLPKTISGKIRRVELREREMARR
jgi:acetyl-CoA synthetase/medium-chain acyl-CoA synthetase